MGYENGYTETILDALKEHGVKAAFFVTGHYVSSAPDIAFCRMANEGHLVCNHTLLHKDMTSPTDELWEEEVYGLKNHIGKRLGEICPIHSPAGRRVFGRLFLTMPPKTAIPLYSELRL